ncbi:MAG: hypothetical protein EKK52_05370 [Burkholderiales bacterium]|uniref:hypothetical protein n=1 Tax=Roseateles sp. TaxID=1971397 RepID=UPI000FB93919|nr:MAG: hypothetical protein EKK52_05370 [Burkholderiales bacterium]
MAEIATNGTLPHDSILIRALMKWPGEGEEEGRRQYYVTDFYRGVAYEPGPPQLLVSVEDIQKLLEAPSWPELVRQAKERTRRGMIAGDVLVSMYLMNLLRDRLPNRGAAGATLDKAFAIADEWARQGNAWGDGVPLAKMTKIKAAWLEFRPVAHLWAAVSMNQVFPYAPAREIFHPNYINAFFRAAAYFQRFGMSFTIPNKSNRSNIPLLDPSTTWALNTGRHPPAAPPIEDLSVFEDSPMLAILRRYQAG